jgi:hypothetical protein
MRLRNIMAIALLALVAGLAGCYESTDVTMHEPGVYKGGKDPLVALEGNSEQQQKLKDRFTLVQADR